MNWPIWLVTLALVVAFGFAYSKFPATRDTVVFIGSSLDIAATVVAALFAAQGLQDAARQDSESIIHSRQEAAFAYMRDWQELPLSTIRTLRANTHDKSPQEIQELLQERPDYAKALELTLNFYEVLGIAVFSDYADEHLLCVLFKDAAV